MSNDGQYRPEIKTIMNEMMLNSEENRAWNHVRRNSVVKSSDFHHFSCHCFNLSTFDQSGSAKCLE
jgi:hypothetical protein